MSTGNPLVLGTCPDGRPIILKPEHRGQHVAITGQTGSGKSKYLESLIRQDIALWPTTHCGVLVVDPHGQLFDNLVAWIAANQLNNLPLVLIDLRQEDTIISYNPLRQRPGDPSVVIDNFIRALAHVWGAADMNATPRLEKWLGNAMHQLYHEEKTLADAWQLFAANGSIIGDLIDDPMIRRDWLFAQKNPKAFEENTESSVSRLRRFLLNKKMRAIFGQTHASLDLGEALDQGKIVLVSLGRKGGTISQENADMFAALLVADYWSAVEERGKCDSNTPAYVYLDEFQRFVTPAMAQSLAEARGFGVGLTLANQFPRQILNAGPHGPRIYDEIRENARTKIVFRLRGKADLETVADELFMGTFDPLRVKHQHSSLKVVGHTVDYLPSYGRSITQSNGGGEQVTTGITHSHTVGSSLSVGHSSGSSLTGSHTDSHSAGYSEGDSWSDGESSGTTTGRNGGLSTGTSHSATRGNAHGASEGFGISGKHVLDEEDEDQTFDDAFDSGKGIQSWGTAESKVASESETDGITSTESAGWSNAVTRTRSAGRGGSRNHNVSASSADGLAYSESETDSITEGVNESFGTSESESIGRSLTWGTAKGRSVNMAPMLRPLMGHEPEAPVFWTTEEQRFLAMQAIHRLKDREAFILAGDMDVPAFIRTPDVTRSDISPVVAAMALGWFQDQTGLALALPDALERISLRDQQAKIVSIEPEAHRPRRRIVTNVMPPV